MKQDPLSERLRDDALGANEAAEETLGQAMDSTAVVERSARHAGGEQVAMVGIYTNGSARRAAGVLPGGKRVRVAEAVPGARSELGLQAGCEWDQRARDALNSAGTIHQRWTLDPPMGTDLRPMGAVDGTLPRSLKEAKDRHSHAPAGRRGGAGPLPATSRYQFL